MTLRYATWHQQLSLQQQQAFFTYGICILSGMAARILNGMAARIFDDLAHPAAATCAAEDPLNSSVLHADTRRPPELHCVGEGQQLSNL